MDTLNFELEIGSGTGYMYPVVARAPGGEATTTMRLPLTLAELDHHLAVVRDKVVASSAVLRGAPTANERPVWELGQRLFDAVIADDVRSLYMASRQRAREQGSVLRVRPPELARLPWEFLFDPSQQDYLGLSMPLVRYPEVLAPRQPLQVALPLRVLGMVARPGDQHALEVDEEQQRLDTALAGLQREELVELFWVVGQTYNALEDALDKGPWHVFHFVGHGGYNRDSEEGTLSLADETGRTHPVGADDISRLLAEHHPLRLVVLNACDTGRGSASDAFSSTAAALIRREIPAVVAMQFEITDPAAIVFAQNFYQHVAKRRPVDDSVMRARRSLRLANKDTLEWGTPVLYLRAPEGQVFDSASLSPSQPRPSQDQIDGRDVEGLYDRALAAFWTERWEEAIALLQQVLAHRPHHHPDVAVKLEQARHRQQLATRYARGCAAVEALDWEEAVKMFTMIMKADPTYRGTAALLARARQELPDPIKTTPPPRSPTITLDPKAVRILRHRKAVNAVAFSPDGQRLATASADKNARIWDATSQQECLCVTHKGVRLNARGRSMNVRERTVAFSPDGRWLATASDDNTARVWDADNERQLAAFTHDNVVVGVVFSPAGHWLATASDNHTARIWDTNNSPHSPTTTQ